jgi:methionyl-tRNA formyltransferase
MKPRIVFFGMDGGYSTVPLAQLVSAQIEVALVIHGIAQKPGQSRAATEVLSVAKPWYRRLGRRGEHDEDTRIIATAKETDLTIAAHRRGIDAIKTTDANSLKVRAKLAGVEPDALVVAGFPHLLSKDVLSLAKKGGLNVHPGKLPEERGPSPLFWALREGRTKIDFTIHVLDEGEDSGDVVSTGELAFESGTDGEDILTACAEAAAPQLVRAVRALLDGDLVRMPQRSENKGRCPRPGFRDGLIDVERSALEVFTFVGGCARTHSIFAECGGDRFFVKKAESYDLEAKLGFEFVLTGDRLLLRCNPGVVELILKEGGALFSAEY